MTVIFLFKSMHTSVIYHLMWHNPYIVVDAKIISVQNSSSFGAKEYNKKAAEFGCKITANHTGYCLLYILSNT